MGHPMNFHARLNQFRNRQIRRELRSNHRQKEQVYSASADTFPIGCLIGLLVFFLIIFIIITPV